MKAGDEVQLKSGGPIMTIDRIENDSAVCVWFNEKNEVKHAVFKLSNLIPFDEPPLAI